MKQKIKILIVDDDLNLRKTLADILRIKGYEPFVAGRGAEAIAAAEHEKFSLALIDLMLPDMPGLDVMARIKEISPLTETIILTGNASLDSAIEATGQGAFSYLLKPYQMDDLLLNIRHGVERQQAQEEIRRLASFPRLTPIPEIEVNSSGEVTYANPAAEKLFPDLNTTFLNSRAWSHPFLNGLSEFNELWQGEKQTDMISEVKIGTESGEATYELHTHYIQELDLIRVYALDITDRKMAEEQIHLLATTDSLTGIANRREFTAMLEREVARVKRYGTPLSLVMFDLDYFKRVNDTFGHDVGDSVLLAVTGLVKKSIRTADAVARWGGEEFMVLMPESNIQAAEKASEKLRLAIAGHQFDTAGKLTASFGVAAFEPHDDVNSLLKRADDALYRAKDKGRNRVETLTGEMTGD
ncbi:MAG: diguanylate cyclase [Desulfobulbaceae bacterium]|nr:diguanylate cyclase [Desulfobulbaceae bacterium]